MFANYLLGTAALRKCFAFELLCYLSSFRLSVVKFWDFNPGPLEHSGQCDWLKDAKYLLAKAKPEKLGENLGC